MHSFLRCRLLLAGFGLVATTGLRADAIRGTPPELNAVTVDGTRSAYPVIGYDPQGDRAVAIDPIPTESIKEIEVTKGRRLGVALSASYPETVNPRDRVQMSHLDPDVCNRRARLNVGVSGRF